MAGEEVSCRHQSPASEASTLSVASSLVSRRHQAPASEAAAVAAMGRQEEGSHRGPDLQHEAQAGAAVRGVGTVAVWCPVGGLLATLA